MKNFPRVQKKGILTSRVLQGNKLQNLNENFQFMVEKQLEDDFKVHQYLNENPNEGHNTEEYIALFNTMLVKKFNKIKKKQFLKDRKNQRTSPDKNIIQRSTLSLTKSCDKQMQADTYYTQEQYLAIKQESEAQQIIIQARTEQELQMKKILLRDITENKKSLNLLKGDIGHMITRNQSISILESKVNKVSLVSQNQLKRVSMALSKDKQEVLLRQDMQKKFNSKLKIIQALQSKNLSKIKASYIQTMHRRKLIFDNLSMIEKKCTSSQEFSDKLKQKQQINIKTLSVFKLLKFICQAIDKSKDLTEKFVDKQIDLSQYSDKLKKIYTYQEQNYLNKQKITTNIFDEQLLNQMNRIIKTDYQRLQKLTQEKKKECRQLMQKIQQYWYKIGNFEKQQKQLLEQFNIQQRNQLKCQSFSHQEYFKIFNQLKKNFNVLSMLINFMNKKIFCSTDGTLVTQIYHNQSFHLKIQSENQQSNKNFNEFMLEQIENKLRIWFSSILNGINLFQKVPQQTKSQMIQQFNKSFCKQRSGIQKLQQISTKHKQINQYGQLVRTSSQIQQHQNKRLISEIMFEKQSISEPKILSSFHKQDYDDQTAKRIQILQKIDQNYYRMIKETIQMEKQNTMKNYQFQRNFKRNKYSSQDQLLQQKRFQASFSNLFKQDPGQTQKQQKFPTATTNFSRFLAKSKQNKFKPIKATINSLHNRKIAKLTTKSFAMQSKKKISIWEKQNKIRLRNKLQDVLHQL